MRHLLFVATLALSSCARTPAPSVAPLEQEPSIVFPDSLGPAAVVGRTGSPYVLEGATLQALMVAWVAGQPVSARTAASWAQEAREAHGVDENVVTNLVANRSGTVTNKPPQARRLKASAAVDRT